MNFVFFQIKILSDQTKRVYEQVINKKRRSVYSDRLF